MLIEIPDDLAREAKHSLSFNTADEYRHRAKRCAAQGDYYASALSLFRAAIVDADLPEPVQVGHLARFYERRDPVLVLAIHENSAWVRSMDGSLWTAAIDGLTYAGPAPEGWGQ